MTIVETTAVFVGIPLGVIAVFTLLIYGLSGRRNRRRYRPGIPYSFAPVWFLAAVNEPRETAEHNAVPRLTRGDYPLGTRGDRELSASDTGNEMHDGVKGGARAKW